MCQGCPGGRCEGDPWNLGEYPAIEEGKLIWKLCFQWERYALEKNLMTHGVPNRFLNASLENYYPQNVNQRMELEQCSQYCEQPFGSNGLMLIGPVGTGKTHLAIAIARKLMKKQIGYYYVNMPKLLAQIRSAMGSNSGESQDFLKELISVNLLIIDDIGAERITDWVREQFYLLINGRYEAALPTIVTTNESMEELEERIGHRVISRLIEMCRGIVLDGPDYRWTKLANIKKGGGDV